MPLHQLVTPTPSHMCRLSICSAVVRVADNAAGLQRQSFLMPGRLSDGARGLTDAIYSDLQGALTSRSTS